MLLCNAIFFQVFKFLQQVVYCSTIECSCVVDLKSVKITILRTEEVVRFDG